MTLVGTALNLGEKMTFFIKPQIWLFHVVVLLTTAKKWTKVKNASAGRAKLLFLPTKIRKFVTFSLPSPLSLLKLPNIRKERGTDSWPQLSRWINLYPTVSICAKISVFQCVVQLGPGILFQPGDPESHYKSQ